MSAKKKVKEEHEIDLCLVSFDIDDGIRLGSGHHEDDDYFYFNTDTGKRLVSPAFSDADGCAELSTLKRSVRSSLRRC